MATTKSAVAELPFILVDGKGRSEPSKRKLIRRHVMAGKNRTQARRSKQSKPATDGGIINPGQVGGLATGLEIKLRHERIPGRVGSELSFTQFAAPVEPSLLHDVLRFSFIAKRVMYPLERCIVFHRKTVVDTMWIELLTSDDAYLHAAVFAAQAYAFHASAKEAVHAARQAMLHQSAALQLLRKRIGLEHGAHIASDPTLLVVLYLTLHAHFNDDYINAMHHLTGLSKLVELRGGLNALVYNTKLILELAKCDLGMALSYGMAPVFAHDAYLQAIVLNESGTNEAGELDLDPSFLSILGIHRQLIHAWSLLMKFCAAINAAFEHDRQLPKDTLLRAMVSVMYPLLHRESDDLNTANEAIRLGLLAISFHIFLKWQDVKIPQGYLERKFRACFLSFELAHDLPPSVVCWLLIHGSLATSTSNSDAWLIPWLRVAVQSSGCHSWYNLRDELKKFPWIVYLHDEPGKALYDLASMA